MRFEYAFRRGIKCDADYRRALRRDGRQRRDQGEDAVGLHLASDDEGLVSATVTRQNPAADMRPRYLNSFGKSK